MPLAKLRADFALFDDWEERYKYIIELGETLEKLTATEYAPAHKVAGCVSQVWLVSEMRGAHLHFRGDSDAHIVRGLIAILLRLYAKKTPSEILSVDAEAAFVQLGLGEHLTPQRSNGFYAMVQRMRSDAEAALALCKP